jgi:phospholipid/cholesterol/gamma-HCH transport system substrate-binding protein
LKGTNIFKPTNLYYVRMPDVSELQNSGPVYVEGFKVGIVRDISYDYQKQGGIVVQISLDTKMKVETGSHVEIKTGLTSGAYLNLILNKYVSTYYQVGDTIDGVSEKGIMDKVSDNLLPQIESLLPRLDSILQGIQFLVSHPALTQSLEQISATTANLEKSTSQLNTLLSNDITPIAANLKQVSSDFTTVSSQLKQMDLNATMSQVNSTLQNLNQMTAQLKSKDNSLGLLLNDRSVYDHLDSTFVNASNLLLDLKLNPKRYVHFSVFGGKK